MGATHRCWRCVSHATNYLKIATALSKDRRSGVAMGFYRRALDMVPQLAPVQFGIGTLLARGGRSEDAIPYYRAALTTWPGYAEARYNLGLALAATGQAQEAAREYTDLARVHRADEGLNYGRAATQ